MEWSSVIFIANCVIAVLFFLCYTYQFVYIPIPFLKKDKPHGEATLHRFAVLIAARNEEKVIGYLIDSIRQQTYPGELISVFVVADNCTDATAQVARDHGAAVVERFNKQQVGKGYAMEYLLTHMKEQGLSFDGYFVFDADNLLAPDYIEQMNRTFSDGHQIITSYRNSKNFGTNWITAGYGLQFLREAVLLNHPRFLLGNSCAVSGTGFFFSQKILEECGGWSFHLLTEDIEFTIHNIINGNKVAYCHDAVYYDEQPVTFRQSWTQRMRWAKGYIQVFEKYGTRMVKGIFKKDGFSCFDMTMNNIPAIFLTAISIPINVAGFILTVASGESIVPMLLAMLQAVVNTYLIFWLIGAIITASEWNAINASVGRKIGGMFTFPIFMMSYIPLSVVALFKKVEWKPIEHTVSVSLKEMNG